jgi:hypothetical protein
MDTGVIWLRSVVVVIHSLNERSCERAGLMLQFQAVFNPIE